MKYVLSLILAMSLMFSSCKKEDLFDPSKSVIPDAESFNELEQQTKDGISLLFFYNTWDKNSAAMLPKLESISQKSEFNDVLFVKVNYDENMNFTQYYVVRGFPVVLILKDGTERARYEGKDHEQEKIEKRLRSLL